MHSGPHDPEPTTPPHDPWQTTRHAGAGQPPQSGPPWQPQQHQPPPVKSRWTPGVIAAVAVVGVLILCVGVVLVGSFLPEADPDPTGVPAAGQTSGAPTRSAPAGKAIRFEVWTDSGTASLVNWSTLEDSAILRDVPATKDEPWVHEASLETAFGLVGVNASAASGLVSCRLLVDGVVVDEGESEGTVNCSATVR